MLKGYGRVSNQSENRLHPLAREAIDELTANGINPTLDESIWLNDLARLIEHPDVGTGLSAGCPARAGNVWLWPLTVAGSTWHSHMAPLFDGQDDVQARLLSFALAHGRTVGAFDGLWSYGAARGAVREWFKSVHCTDDELILAVNAVLAQDGEGETELDPDHPQAEKQDPGPADTGSNDQAPPNAPDWSETIALLCSAVSGPPELWESRVSRRFLLTQINTLNKQNSAAGEAPDPCDPHIVASRNLLRAQMNIEHRHRKASEGSDDG